MGDLEERNTAAVEKKSIYQNLDWDSWAKDSFNIAKTLYSGKFQSDIEFDANSFIGIVENDLPPDDYVEDGKLIAESQIMLGGYRLAYTLNYIFGDAKSREEHDQAAFIADVLSNLLQ